jgi:hypothetical protein
MFNRCRRNRPERMGNESWPQSLNIEWHINFISVPWKLFVVNMNLFCTYLLRPLLLRADLILFSPFHVFVMFWARRDAVNMIRAQHRFPRGGKTIGSPFGYWKSKNKVADAVGLKDYKRGDQKYSTDGKPFFPIKWLRPVEMDWLAFRVRHRRGIEEIKQGKRFGPGSMVVNSKAWSLQIWAAALLVNPITNPSTFCFRTYLNLTYRQNMREFMLILSKGRNRWMAFLLKRTSIIGAPYWNSWSLPTLFVLSF